MFHVPPPDAEAEPVEADGRELHTPASPHPDPAPLTVPLTSDGSSVAAAVSRQSTLQSAVSLN